MREPVSAVLDLQIHWMGNGRQESQKSKQPGRPLALWICLVARQMEQKQIFGKIFCFYFKKEVSTATL